MNRYQIIIEYVGTNFKGWQIQKKGTTVQGIVQEKLSKLLKQKISIIGSGRTDAGVHAIEQSAHFECMNEISDSLKFIKSVNHFLNYKNIAITKIKKRNKKFHARFSAKKRIYKYIILNRVSSPVLEKKRVWHVRKKLNIDLMLACQLSALCVTQAVGSAIKAARRKKGDQLDCWVDLKA